MVIILHVCMLRNLKKRNKRGFFFLGSFKKMCSDGSGVLEIIFLGTQRKFKDLLTISTLKIFQICHKFGKK